MERSDAGITGAETQHFPLALVRLGVRAAQEIRSHTSKDRLCAVCGTTWPCERAELAEHNLALM